MASMLGLIFSVLVFLIVIIQLEGDRITLLANVPTAHVSLTNLLVIVVGLVGGVTITVGLAIAGFLSFSRR